MFQGKLFYKTRGFLMVNPNTMGNHREIQNPLVQRFAEKSELLLIESCKLVQEESDTLLMISLLSYHQATEFSLKAYCILTGVDIYKRDRSTISFYRALNSQNILDIHEKQLLASLNNIRNSLQHNAFFDISSRPLFIGLLESTIVINKKIYQAINYDDSELDVYLESNYSDILSLRD